MKKYLVIIFILLAGCSSKKMICTKYILNESQNYEQSSTYIIYFNNGYVNKIEENNTYSSNDVKMINYFDNYMEKSYINFKKEYKYINYRKDIQDNKIFFQAQYDYNKIDGNKLSKNNYIDKLYVSNQRVNVSGIKLKYEQLGFVCK